MNNTQIAYDYLNQAWVENGVYVACAHPPAMNCGCYGKLHAGETPDPANSILIGQTPVECNDLDEWERFMVFPSEVK